MQTVLITVCFPAILCIANTQSIDHFTVIDSSNTFNRLTQPIERGTLIKTSTFHFYETTDKITQKTG